jgi:beta-1,4-mannosyl-glycoprotein beta-1,4-N-acetylglucosaminyltransferase
MVYDCFPFFNELDLLEIRLNILSKIVDKFVLIEADRTFSYQHKPFYFSENKFRYSDFLHKIIHIQITEYPANVEKAWIIENYQRNKLIDGLVNCNPNDIILVSDLDEIPNPEIIRNFTGGGIYKLEQKHYCYYLNYKNITQYPWYGTRIMLYKDIIMSTVEQYEYKYGTGLVYEINQGTTFAKIRLAYTPLVKNGGWHFSYLGGLENIKAKLSSFVIQESVIKKTIDSLTDKVIEKRMKNGIDLFSPKESRWIPIKITKRDFPEYLVVNQERYSHLIYSKVSIISSCFMRIAGLSVYISYIFRIIQNKFIGVFNRFKRDGFIKAFGYYFIKYIKGK